MNTDNLFELALHKKKSNEFFRGDGEYFVPSPDYGGHVHGAHMGGWVESFLKTSDDNLFIFTEAFTKFLVGLDVTGEDLNHLLSNLSAYFALKNKGRLESAKLFLDVESAESVALKDYLLLVINSKIFTEEKSRLYRHANFISLNGSDFVLDILGGNPE